MSGLSVSGNYSASTVGVSLAVPTKCIEEAGVVSSVIVHEFETHFVAFPYGVRTVGPVQITLENVDIIIIFAESSLSS